MRERVIVHVDMDSYFASVEQQENPLLRRKPIAVCGPCKRTVIAASSREAKKFGVKSAMAIPVAKKLCPQLILVPGDFKKYASTSKKIFKILSDYTPYLEIFSIDEAFLDVTHSQHLFGGAVDIAKEIKKRIKKEIGEFVTCSIGISVNKLLAKLASEMDKPDGLVVIQKGEIPKFLAKMKLSDSCGVGPKTVEHLKRMGINNIEQLAKTPERILREAFGVYGKFLKDTARGINDSPIIPYWQSPLPKSVGNRTTLPFDIDELEKIKPVLLDLSEQVGRRMRKEKMLGKTITVTIRTFDFQTFSKQKTLRDFIDNGFQIYQEALKILLSCFPKKKIRMIGVSVSGLIQREAAPLFLLSEDRRESALLIALDEINNRFGEFTISRASLWLARDLRKDVSEYERMTNFGFGKINGVR